jgi:hypothetical protein
MSLFSSSPISALLKGHAALLREIFGEEFEIKDDAPDHAIVRSDKVTVQFDRDRRDGDTGALIELHDPRTLAEPFVWLRFLGEGSEPKPRNATGHIQMSAEQQIEAELQVLLRLEREIFSDRQRSRDAAHFVQGYNASYNDYCSGRSKP